MVVMFDGNKVVGPVVSVAVMPGDNVYHFPAAGGANVRTDRHGEVIGETFQPR